MVSPSAEFRPLSSRRPFGCNLIRLAVLLTAAVTTINVVHGAATAQDRRSAITKFPLPGVFPDPFIAAAPLIAGVVCCDGVLLLALHTAFSNDTGVNDESFLLLKDEMDDDSVDQNSSSLISSKDLPTSYRGPFRICTVGGGSSSSGNIAIVCAGWRTDSQRLVELIRYIDKQEKNIFGDMRQNNNIHGSFLACTASQTMADQCVTDGQRPFSCLGLLASYDDASNSGCLWLVDATGAYRVRAHAVGGGILAHQMNEIFQSKDWSTLSCEDVARELLYILFEDIDSNIGEMNDSEMNTTTNLQVPKGSLTEMAAVGLKQGTRNGKLTRLFSSTLFGQTTR